MAKYTREDIYQMIEEEDVEFIRLQFTDLFGTLKNIAVTISQLERVLDNKISFDGASIDGFVKIEKSDLFLHPDLDTFCIFPWRPQRGKVARFICDIYNADGTPFAGDPRYILKKVIADAKEMDYILEIGPECEFFLFHTDDKGRPTTKTHEEAGYFDVAPMDLGENARRDIVLTLEEMGYVVEASHHESAPAQHEIDFLYSEALAAADGVMTTRLAVKSIAQRHGLHASFMPKPLEGVNGSGMHINMSIKKDGQNLFYDKKSIMHMSDEAYYFIGGIMKHIAAITAITNPLVNSYKRLIPGYEAPVYVAWSITNRSPLIRIPAIHDDHQRIELRSPDSAANPYFAIAVCMAAGLDGIKNKIVPPDSVDKNIFAMSEEELQERQIECLPTNLITAIHELEKDKFICDVLGEHVVKRFVKAKKEEWAEYKAQVSAWEINRYLSRI